ncbi:YdcF family protein [Actinacidiphila acidipaludis]|uniref:YdcF family protein n=1 Tax=Actinacidiphila acidipaludis TaxID=2873382 RepID=A0ABS7QEQ2_9ACTN|nr:YdcF family protein [Streptomyces acidipaludis]MBY8881179.1 YdcF family protein [Streptomyces acidipaludis]
MWAYLPALVCFLAFAFAVLRERRRFGNAVLLGLSLTLGLGAWLFELHREHHALARGLVLVLIGLGVLGVVTLTWFMISNGLVMVRKEGVSPANLLSLLAGIALLGLVALVAGALLLDNRLLQTVAAGAVAVSAYVGFLFFCFVAYAFLYGRLHYRRKADYVVVLGSGLAGGSKVPPLLASRLDKAQAVHGRLSARGRRPMILASGGQGPDEQVPESHAMADYLLERGVPASLLLREDRSTTTAENLRFSKAIMEEATPGYRCVIVTNNYHVFRAALLARRARVRGQVVGSPTASYFLPSATIREFVALLVAYRRVHLTFCLGFVVGAGAIWWLG